MTNRARKAPRLLDREVGWSATIGGKRPERHIACIGSTDQYDRDVDRRRNNCGSYKIGNLECGGARTEGTLLLCLSWRLAAIGAPAGMAIHRKGVAELALHEIADDLRDDVAGDEGGIGQYAAQRERRGDLPPSSGDPPSHPATVRERPSTLNCDMKGGGGTLPSHKRRYFFLPIICNQRPDVPNSPCCE